MTTENLMIVTGFITLVGVGITIATLVISKKQKK